MNDNKNIRDDRNGNDRRALLLIPPKVGLGIALIAFLVAMMTYMLAVPFDLVFMSGDTEVYRQESVGVLGNVVKNAADDEGSSGWNKVYGENRLTFIAADGENDVYFEENYSEVKKLMMRTALTNLFTFSWAREDFTIEFTAK